LYLADGRRLRTNFGLEHDVTTLKAGEGASGRDQTGHPTAVTAPTVTGPWIYADLADEHVNRGHQIGIEFLDPHPPHPGVQGAPGARPQRHQRLPIPDVSRRAPTVLQPIQSGRLRAIAVASPNRSPYLPDLPTLAQAGVPGVEADAWLALFAPSGLAITVLNRLREATAAAMKQPAVIDTLKKSGMTPNARSGEAFGAFVREDVERWAQVVRAAGVKAD
jgi:hypothetical protein